jgi:hypothetical protein
MRFGTLTPADRLMREPFVKIVEQRPEHRQSSMAVMGLG